MFASEARRQGALFERVVDGGFFLEEGAEGEGETSPELGEEEGLGGLVQDYGLGCREGFWMMKREKREVRTRSKKKEKKMRSDLSLLFSLLLQSSLT